MRMFLLVSLTAFVAGSAAQAQMNNADLKWGPAPAGLPAGAQAAVLSGDPERAGMFTIRLKFPPNYAVAPHHHPADELVTVIDGQVNVGMGDKLDRAKAKALNEDGFTVMPAKMSHYGFTTGGATIQVTSTGPFAITYVNPKDDPRGAAAPAPQSTKPPENMKPPERGE